MNNKWHYMFISVYSGFFIVWQVTLWLWVYKLWLNSIDMVHSCIWTTSQNVSRTFSWGVPATPWAQGAPRCDTRDLWRHWWEGPSDPNVSVAPAVQNAFQSRGLRVPLLERSRTPQLEVWARRYGTLCGTLSRDCSGTWVAPGTAKV
jgi:hypothetical protein